MQNNYEYKKISNLMEDGDYEVKIENMEVRTLSSGKEKLSITFRVRDDIEGQKYGNKVLWEDIWKEKESPEHFNRKRLNQLIGTQDIKDGTVFESINDIINSLVGGCLIVHIITTFDDYRGEDVNRISYYKSSKNKPTKLGEVELNITSDDMPF